MMKKAIAAFLGHRSSIIVLIAALGLTFSGLLRGSAEASYPPDPLQVYRRPSLSSGIELSRRQQGSPQMDEDTRRNWKTYQGLTPEDKNRLRDKSEKWQSLPPDQQQEMRRRMERYRELPPQDQERYEKRYQQWQSLPPEDRNQIRDRLRHWDSLSPQEQQEIRQRFQKR
jgi:hypothetical protein